MAPSPQFRSTRRRPGRPIAVIGLVALLASSASLGCGYSLRAPFEESIRTVYVPIFRSYSFRDDVNIRLQEVLVKEIENRTTYRVVDSPEKADVILSGTILYTTKFTSVINPNNYPRQLFADMSIEVTYEDLRNPLPEDREPPKVYLSQTVPFFPEPGETAFLAYDEAIRRAATDIVNMMEEPW